MVAHDVSYGALTQLYAGTSEEGATLNGQVGLLSFNSTRAYIMNSTLYHGHVLEIHVRTRRMHNRDRSYGAGLRNKSRTFRYIRLSHPLITILYGCIIFYAYGL